MKKIILLLILLLLLFSMTSCGKYSSSYKAVAFVHSNETSTGSMSFASFDGKMVFKLQSTGEGDLQYEAKMESGQATVYYDFYGTKTELFSISGGEEIDARGGYVESGTVYVIVETDGECKNGSFIIKTGTVDPTALRERYPEYFGLDTSKGLELYVWQMGPDSYSCGLMSGTDREKTFEELMNMKGTTIDDMKAILSSYEMNEEDISIIPWQNPISSYIADYWVSEKDEDSASIEKRKQEYIDRIHSMLFDSSSIL